MAIYPAAVRRLIPPGTSDPRIKPRVVILHVAVSEAASLYDYFANRSGGIESHFYVRRDGTVEQYRDTDWQADANYQANDFAISVETQGMEHGEWGADQLDAIKALLRWCNQAHGIPLVKAARWDGTGVGYHSQFDPWSPVAKSCPGPDRIRQFNDVLVPWMSGNPEEDDMALEQDDINKIATAVWAKEFGGDRAALLLQWAGRNAARVNKKINRLDPAKADEIARAVVAKLPAQAATNITAADLARALIAELAADDAE